MSRQSEREAVIVRGVLDGGRRLEWRATDSNTIYVGSDPRCQWRLDDEGVAPFHLHLCWYGQRLWMSELAGRPAATPGGFRWTIAPVGVVLRLGGTVILFEVGVPAPRLSDSDPTYHGRDTIPDQTFVTFRADEDPNATQLVEPDELRALPSFGPPAMLAPAWSHQVPQRPEAPVPRALEEMFIIPVEQVAPPPRPPGRLARAISAMPLRVTIALLAASSAALVVFLPESLHATHNTAPLAVLPPRRPPPDPQIDIRAVEPDPDKARARTEREAARDLAAGRLEEALGRYRELQEAVPDNPVFRDFASVVARRVRDRCKQGNCKEESP